jgi:hypothetical protein
MWVLRVMRAKQAVCLIEHGDCQVRDEKKKDMSNVT